METARRAQIMAAAIDTIAKAGFAGASFAHIAGKLGISRGLISYHFAGKDDLVKEVIHQAAEQAKAFIRPRILAEPTSPGMLRAYIESNLAFMRDHRNNVIAMVEIAGSTEGDASSTATLTWSMRSAPSSTCCLASRQQASSVLTSTPTSWPSRSAPRSRPHRPG